MLELKPNTTMNNQELAEWFGIKYNSFRNNKAKKLEELKNFCDYEMVNNKTYKIKEVFEPCYHKQRSKTRTVVEENWEGVWSPNGWDSCARVGMELYDSEREKLGDVQLKTVVSYTSRAKRDSYGVAYVRTGSKGSCEMELCIKSDDGKIIPLNEEQKKIKNDLCKKYFGNADDKMIVIQAMVKAGEIKKEDAWGIFEEWTDLDRNFMEFLRDLQAQLGCKVTRGTYIPALDKTVVNFGEYLE